MDDLISRQDAIDILDAFQVKVENGEEFSYSWARMRMTELPSVHPERKTGRWIYGEHDVTMCDGYHCSECGFFVPWDYKRKFIDFIKDYNFCPNCGSPMVKEGEA